MPRRSPPDDSPSPTPTLPGAPPLSRRDLKSVLLWAARMLASEGGKGLYAEPVRVRVEKVSESESVEVRSSRVCDGMALPESVAATRSGPPASGSAGPDELLRVMFSRDEIRILSQMVADVDRGDRSDGGVKRITRAKSIQDATKIPEGKFWVLWSNLQQRGVVVDATEGEGFEIGPGWVREWVREREGIAAA